MKGQFKVWFQTPATFVDVSDWRAVCKIPRARVFIWNCEFRHQNLPESDLASTLEPSGTWPGSCIRNLSSVSLLELHFRSTPHSQTYPNVAPHSKQKMSNPRQLASVPQQKSAMIPDPQLHLGPLKIITGIVGMGSETSNSTASQRCDAQVVHPDVPHHLVLRNKETG